MDTLATDFYKSKTLEPHQSRTKAILEDHPEIRSLIGRNPYSFLLILGLVVLQFAVAIAVADSSWWLVLLLAYTIGGVSNHALFVLIHDACHKLIFKGSAANKWSAILANLPGIVPSAVSFQIYHLKHHSFQGDYEKDADMPGKWEAKLVGITPWGKAVWLLFHALFYAARPLRLRGISFFSGWTVINVLVVFACDAAILLLFGPKALIYMLASTLFSLGLHPLGARWIQEHFVFNPPQETYSYYGPLNTVALNVGYHNEHHDFPSIPWNRLPQVRAMAPEWYNSLAYHTSWTKLLFRFLSDPKVSLFSRIERPASSVN